MQRASFMNTTSAFLIALAWRVLIAVSTRTFFQPDEFYQSLEVAHYFVFGYGHLTWEWTVSPPIRSIFFPSLYVPVYWLLKITRLDNGSLLIITPKILQGAIASIADVSTRELTRRSLGDRYADTAFLLSLTSFFHILSLSRTLSNSVETSLTAAAFCFWPWLPWHVYDRRRLWLAFALAAASCLIRPTSVLLWAFLSAELLRFMLPFEEPYKRVVITFIRNGLLAALITVGLLVLVDSVYFGSITFTPFNFVRTNLSSLSLFYGRAPWHYYLTQGVPILLNVCLPSFIFGAWDSLDMGFRDQWSALYLILWTVFVYSLLGHKEWRFLHPILPLMILFAARSLVGDDEAIGFGESFPKKKKSARSEKSVSLKTKLLCALGVLPGIYVVLFHGRAQISVMHYLRSLDPSVLRSVGFLMPCHSTPWQAYLHRPELSEGYMWALSCEPPLHGANISTYRDQTDIFYASSISYLKQNFPPSVDPSFPPSPYPTTTPGGPPPKNNRWDHRWPSHLVFFGALIIEGKEGAEVEEFLKEAGYGEVWNATNGFEEDWRRRGGVTVWQWQPKE